MLQTSLPLVRVSRQALQARLEEQPDAHPVLQRLRVAVQSPAWRQPEVTQVSVLPELALGPEPQALLRLEQAQRGQRQPARQTREQVEEERREREQAGEERPQPACFWQLWRLLLSLPCLTLLFLPLLLRHWPRRESACAQFQRPIRRSSSNASFFP